MADLSGTAGFAADVEIADETGLDLQTIRAYLDALERRGLTRSANSFDGYAARLTGEGRLTIDAEITDEESELLTTISAMQPNSRSLAADTAIAARAGLALQRVRDLLDRLEGKGLVRLAKSFDGYSAAITGEPDPAHPGFGEYRLKDRGVPIWAIIGSLTEDADNIDEVAEAYDLPREAVEAALAFYRRHHAAIDARLAQNAAGLIHHSDWGVQYASGAYVERLEAVGARISMAARGNPYENAQAESFFKTLKHEEVSLKEYRTFEDALVHLDQFIEKVYNTKGRHASLGYVPPVEFEAAGAMTGKG